VSRWRSNQTKQWTISREVAPSSAPSSIAGKKSTDPEERIAALRAALELEPRLNGWPEGLPLNGSRQQVRSTLQEALGDNYRERRKGNREENLEKAIVAYQAALTVFTSEAMPWDWARIQNKLGITFENRVSFRDYFDNVEKAIIAFHEALTIFTRDAMPQDWARTQNNLAVAFTARGHGKREDNFEDAIAAAQAALTVFTREITPQDWAQAQDNLARALTDRVRGEREDNVENAIAAAQAALTVFTREATPQDWARTQNDLARAFALRVRGDRADNQGKEIDALEAVITLPREVIPLDWGERS
jgi:tetratricopeptide (TPR) repeat protein